MDYHTKFGGSRSNLLGVGKLPKIWGTLSPAPWDEGGLTPRNMLLPHLCYYASFWLTRSNDTSVITEMRRINLTPHAPLIKVT